MTVTNAAFVSAMQGITVTGVSRHYDEPPQSLKTADLPAAFPMPPSGDMLGNESTCSDGDNKVRSMRYIIAIEAKGQGTNATNYAQIAALMDNLETALDAVHTSSGFVFPLTYSITSGAFGVAGSEYWSIIATVTGRDRP